MFTSSVFYDDILGQYSEMTVDAQQSGSGIFAPLAAGAQAFNTASDIVFGPIGTTISNKISEKYNKNDLWRPGFAGEKHMILPTSKGLTRANFAGPGTKIHKRMKRGDKGVDGPNGIDAAAMVHDILYTNANDYNDIQRADTKFINDVSNSTQSRAVKTAVIGAIKAKNIGEKIGLISKDAFVGSGDGAHSFNIISDTRHQSLHPAQFLMKKQKAKQKGAGKRKRKKRCKC